MNKKWQDAQDALDKIDAPDNDENDRMDEADNAIRAISQMSDEDQESFAKKEFKRFQDWLSNRLKGKKPDLDDDDYGDSPTGRL